MPNARALPLLALLTHFSVRAQAPPDLIAKDLGARESFFSIDRLFSLCSLSSQSISCAGKSASGLKEVVEEFKTGMAEGETGVSQDGGATAVKSAEPAPEEKTDA